MVRSVCDKAQASVLSTASSYLLNSPSSCVAVNCLGGLIPGGQAWELLLPVCGETIMLLRGT